MTVGHTWLPQGGVCVISQPTFLPWLGWFDLADQADTMVILDDVAFSKQSWQQRNRIRTARGLEFLSVPVRTTGRLGQRIDDCELADQHFVRKMIASLRTNYAKARGAAMLDELAEVLAKGAATGKLVELNCALIDWIAARLEVQTPMVRASTLNAGGQRGEHVAVLCEALQVNNYLAPAGALDYLREDRAAFESRGIEVWLHAYDHPQYTQRHDPFMPYASALDLILNEGAQSGSIMRSGRRPPQLLGEVPMEKEQTD